jgi:hypothetical protein
MITPLSKGQPGLTKVLVQPDAEVMLGNLRGQARLQSTELPRSSHPRRYWPSQIDSVLNRWPVWKDFFR